MDEIKVGDIVARKSYGLDIFFKVVDINGEGDKRVITLKGITYRIEADAPESDLILQTEDIVSEYSMRTMRAAEEKYRDLTEDKSRRPKRMYHMYAGRGYPKKAFYRDTPKDNGQKFSRPGKVLHIDGDDDYLETCLKQYKKFGIEVVGKYVPEKDQPSVVYKLLQEHVPDILVLTGHDGVIKDSKNYLNVDSYRNSRFYIESVKEARRYENDMDSLVIFAGACQSMYDNIIKAGANFASSPKRVLIHAMDPVFVCQKVAFTGFDKVLDPSEVIGATITGLEGIGGLQTRGKYREGFPAEEYTD